MTSTKLDNDAHIQKRRMIDKVVIYVKRDPDLDDIQSSNKENIEYIKHNLKAMVDYNGNTTEYHPDGKIEITPNYLKPIPDKIVQEINTILCQYYRIRDQRRLEQRDLYELTLVSKQFYHQSNCLLWNAPFIYNSDVLQRFQNCLNIIRFEQSFTLDSYGLDDSTHDIPHKIIMAKHHVRRLHLDGNHWDDVRFSIMMSHLSLLEDLSINNTGDRITASSLIHFPRYFPHLTTLTLRVSHLTQDCMDAIAQHCYQLRELELPTNNLVPSIFKAFADNVSCTTTLQKLCFYYMDSSPRRIGPDFPSADMIKDMARFKCLTCLQFEGRSYPIPLNQFLTATTSEGTAAWPSLTTLNIDNGNRLDEASLISFLKSHPSLKEIFLVSSAISDSTLDAIGTHLPKLSQLILENNNNITANAVYRLTQRCQDLDESYFANCITLFSLAPELSMDKDYFTDEELANIRQRGDQ